MNEFIKEWVIIPIVALLIVLGILSLLGLLYNVNLNDVIRTMFIPAIVGVYVGLVLKLIKNILKKVGKLFK